MIVNKEKLDVLLKKIHPEACPLCGNKRWEVSNRLFQLQEFNAKQDKAIYPIIPVACVNCGNTYFINALVTGLVDRENPYEDNQKTATQESER